MTSSATQAKSLSDVLSTAIRHHQAGQLHAAETMYNHVLAVEPENFDALHLLGVLAHQVGRNDVAINLISKAIRQNAAYPAAYVHLGEAFRALGRYDSAENCYRQAISLTPDCAEAYNNLGIMLLDLGRVVEAEQAVRRALAIKPDFVEAYNNLGNILRSTGLLCEAEQAYRAALTLNPDHATTHGNLGLTLKELGKLGEAALEYRHALKLQPDFAAAFSGLGSVLKELGNYDDAEQAFKTALAIKPDLHECRLKLAMLLPPVVETVSEADAVIRNFNDALGGLEAATGPDDWPHLGAAIGVAQAFNLAYRLGNHTSSLARYGDIACRARKAWLAASRPMLLPARLPLRNRVRLVIVSGHVRQHPVWNVLLHGLLRHLDRQRFEVILYRTGQGANDEISVAATLVDRMVQEPVDWLERIYSDAPDVIFYPEIGMDPATLKLATLRLAPLQVAGWGHPITTGLPTIDLFISGELIEREDADDDYRETLVRLPGTGACAVPMQAEPVTLEPSAINLPPDRTITRFLICQQALKLDPCFDELYPRIARAAGPCRFWFVRDSKIPWGACIVEKRIRKAFTAAGLDPANYVHFIDWLPTEQFWGLLDAMDVYLDTPAFSGYTTAWQAARRGLPVVTLEGRFMRQRLAAGLLRGIGMTETIAGDEAEYVAKAAALARDPEGRMVLRTRLRLAAPKADEDTATVRAFEAAIIHALAGRERVFGG